MTLSIAARCPQTGMFGLAIASSSPAVAARCVHVRAGVGAVASQNVTDPALGLRGLDLLATGRSAAETLADLLVDYPHAAYRQLALVDRHGGTAVYTGAKALGLHASAEGPGCVAAGNLLATTHVPSAMIAAFARGAGQFGDRLLAALAVGLAAGGEAGPLRSASLCLVREVAWPVADLRVDWTDKDPIAELQGLWRLYEPQLDDYVRRALDPEAAPSYGVPGDP